MTSREQSLNNGHIAVEIQYASQERDLPGEADLRRWAALALGEGNADTELVIRIVDEPEGRQLNRQFRERDYATNVLSFPFEAPPGLNLSVLGDLVICAPVVIGEAAAHGKEPAAHWAHMVIHGTLHLLGHDHIQDSEAEQMEKLEAMLLARLGYPDPYMELS
ncbi:MAG: rRNA maturation RNase YbeY [Aquisalimonadaceae bacterium]